MADQQLKVVFTGDPKPLQATAGQVPGIVRQATAGATQIQAQAAAQNLRVQQREVAGWREQYAARVTAAQEASRRILGTEASIQAALRNTRELLRSVQARPAGWDGAGITGVSAATAARFRGGSGAGAGLGALGFASGTALGVAGIYAATRAVRDFLSAADAVDKASQRVAFPVEEYQRLAHAAELSGASIEKLETSIRTMQDRIQGGTPESTAAFQRLGFTLEQLQAMRPEEQFDQVARRVAAIEDPVLRNATAMDIWGLRTGTALLPMLAALDKLKAAAPVMAEAGVQGAVIFNDAMTTAKARTRSFLGESMGGLAMMGGWAKRGVGAAAGAVGELFFGMEPGGEAEAAPAAQVQQADQAAAAAQAVAAANAQRREAEDADFRAEMAHRQRLAEIAGQRDWAALRAQALGLRGVEALGGGDRGRGMDVIEAEERQRQDGIAQRTRAQEEAQRAAARSAEEAQRARVEAEREAERQAKASAREALQAKKAADREAAESARTAARQAQEYARQQAEAARKQFGFALPGEFRTMLGWNAQERRRRRETRETDDGLGEKLAAMAAGERVHFTPRELRRLRQAQRVEDRVAAADEVEAPRRGRGLGRAARAGMEAAARGGQAAGAGAAVGDATLGKLDLAIAELRNIRAEIREGGLV